MIQVEDGLRGKNYRGGPVQKSTPATKEKTQGSNDSHSYRYHPALVIRIPCESILSRYKC